MIFLDEDEFDATFGKRLRFTRTSLGMSRPTLAGLLGITKDQLKRYEGRPNEPPSSFPLYLIPALIHYTGEPYAYWSGDQPSKRTRFYVVPSSKPDPTLRAVPEERLPQKGKPEEQK